ncbi:MAG: hypothetical protein Q7I94_05220 [Candidatus Contubernalis sp.]|nr:hypothetical protein [Candidatus Contubernalis sp.]
MIILGIVLGVLMVIVGLLYLFSPGLLVKLNEWGKRTLFSDEWTVGHRLLMGIFFLLVGLFVLYLIFLKR